MPFTDPEHGKRRFYWLSSLLATTTLAVGGLTISYLDYRAGQERRECERVVEARDDGRAMWLVLFDRFADRPAVPELRADLDELLPQLHCVDNTPIPVPVEE